MAIRHHRLPADAAGLPERPPLGDIDATLAVHLRAVGGSETHVELLDWARAFGYPAEELDRCLVRACHAGTIAIDVGEPPCTATRVAHLRPTL